MASGGYPEHYDKGFPITGLQNVDGAVVFHCGTKFDGEAIVTNGGRVLGVTALGETLEAAREAAYDNVKHVRFNEAFYRMDIAKRIERM
jgi:phosphoribosylamine--glycine ligase